MNEIQLKIKEQQLNQQKNLIIEKQWMHYFTSTLFSKGIITNQDRDRLTNMIENIQHHISKTI